MSEVPKATFVWLPHLRIYLGTHPLHSQALPSVCVPGPNLSPKPQGSGRSQALKDAPRSHHSCAGAAAQDGWNSTGAQGPAKHPAPK